MDESQDLFNFDDDSDSSIKSPASSKKRVRKQSAPWPVPLSTSLVLAVEKHECIWSPAHEEYKNGKMKKLIWQDISKEVGRPGNECSDRWGVLRVAYKVS